MEGVLPFAAATHQGTGERASGSRLPRRDRSVGSKAFNYAKSGEREGNANPHGALLAGRAGRRNALCRGPDRLGLQDRRAARSAAGSRLPLLRLRHPEADALRAEQPAQRVPGRGLRSQGHGEVAGVSHRSQGLLLLRPGVEGVLPFAAPAHHCAGERPAGSRLPHRDRPHRGSSLGDLMPHATAKDGTRLYYEESGSGTPLVFVHEFAGDYRSWEPQLRFFARYFRCVAYNARGFPPSDVPEDGARYSQAHARDDIVAVLDHLRVDKAHLVGLSMGGFAVLHAGIAYPQRARSLVIGGCGYGAEPDKKAKFQAECEAAAASFDANWSEAAKKYALGPTRVQFQNKDPRGWAEFAQQLRDGSSKGHALTMRGVQMKRPSLYELVDGMKKIDLPALILTGDEDDPCLEPALLMKRSIATAGLVVLPYSGHTINIEEPHAFNRALFDYLMKVDEGRATRRDPRSAASSILGFKK